MIQKENNLNFKNIESIENNETNTYSDDERMLAVQVLMDKYNISENDAQNALDKIEKKLIQKNIENQQKNVSNKITNQNFQQEVKLQQASIENTDMTHKDMENVSFEVFSDKKESGISSDNFIKNDEDISQKMINNSSNSKNDVDDIISDLIPDYNKSVSIELNDVSLTFEVVTDKIDTIKETFIRTLKRNKSKKVKFQALKDITFKVYKGEKIGIIGYNGAGKSTLLNVISGIYLPDKGTVETYGKISPLLSLGAGFDSNYSGRKNIFLNGAVLGYNKSFLESKVDEIIEFSELEDFIDFPIKNYSSGMLAKLGFSIATAVNPDILIIDEVLGVGDVNFAKKSKDKIRSLMDGGTTVLLVSHSIPQVRELCDKAIWIDNGRIREIGEVNKVCDNYLRDAEKASNEQLANIQFR